jgi:hypothetical protein
LKSHGFSIPEQKHYFWKIFGTKIVKKKGKYTLNFCGSPRKKSSTKKNSAEKAETIFNTADRPILHELYANVARTLKSYCTKKKYSGYSIFSKKIFTTSQVQYFFKKKIHCTFRYSIFQKKFSVCQIHYILQSRSK